MNTPAHLLRAWAAAQSPEAKAKRSETLSSRWKNDADFRDRCSKGLRDPDSQRRAGITRRIPLSERFMAKVDKVDSGCWHWVGAKNERGYGFINDRTGSGKKLRATHVSLDLAGHSRPDANSYALHSCDNPQCVNPDHLRWGTQRENISDMIDRGRADFSGLRSIGCPIKERRP